MSSAPAPTQAARLPGADAGYQPDPKRWRALTVCLVAGFMTLLDVSIVNVALPSISAALGAGQSALQWIVSGYALTFGLLLVPAGRFGDAYGRRTAFLVGLGGFVAASVGCGLSPNPTVLVVARLIQGAAGGILIPQVSALIQQLFRGRERAKAFGLLGATIGLSTAVGPLLGGGLIALLGPDLGWRAVFFVNLPVGVLAMLLALSLIPRVPASQDKHDLDPVGVVLLGAAVTLLLLPLIQNDSLGLPVKLGLYVLSVVTFGTWFGWERRHARTGEPVVDLALFRTRSYALGSGVGLVYFAGFTALFFLYTVYLQDGLRYTALEAGLAVTPFAVGSAGAAALGGRLVPRLGRTLVAGGLALTAVGFLATWIASGLVPGERVALATAAPLLVAGIGSGLTITPNVTLTLSEVPVAQAGSAGGVLQTAQRIGAAAGIAVAGSVFFSAARRAGLNHGFRVGLLVLLAFVVAAFVLALLDVLTGRGGEREAHPANG